MANFQKIEVSTEIFTQILLDSIAYHIKTLLNNKNITQHTKNRQFVICHNALCQSPTVRGTVNSLNTVPLNTVFLSIPGFFVSPKK